MLWDPPHRKGLSKSFQPKWKGPWTIIKLIGNTNCQIQNEKGDNKYVHLNQLKKTERRKPFYNRNSKFSPNENAFKVREEVDSSIFEIPNRPNEEYVQYTPRHPIDNAYVDVDESNIVENRLRTRR